MFGHSARGLRRAVLARRLRFFRADRRQPVGAAAVRWTWRLLASSAARAVGSCLRNSFDRSMQQATGWRP